ncbi:hypothetical protein BJV78DRAFT_237431 [Lactifluus subvellereus]|nr:hypothetical protein BJV78DRAFT_237431 [Lactifluus subvellereus]
MTSRDVLLEARVPRDEQYLRVRLLSANPQFVLYYSDRGTPSGRFPLPPESSSGSCTAHGHVMLYSPFWQLQAQDSATFRTTSCTSCLTLRSTHSFSQIRVPGWLGQHLRWCMPSGASRTSSWCRARTTGATLRSVSKFSLDSASHGLAFLTVQSGHEYTKSIARRGAIRCPRARGAIPF